MDLLMSLNLDDLPEQQTRMSHLYEEHPDFQLKLGFDACCACGKPGPTVDCDGCRRVKYCSNECREKDTLPPNDGQEEEALGHASVICALLRLCNDDEAVEQGGMMLKSLSKTAMEAATDRLSREFESYPATLANVLADVPCYQDTLQKQKNKSLIIHIVGASQDSELWHGHPDPVQEKNVFQCYAEALAELSETKSIKTIELHFVGPECPKQNIKESIPIPSMQEGSNLIVRTYCEEYSSMIQRQDIPSVDVVVFFNPGFTCPDYDWKESLACFDSNKETAFLITTNTELEAIADIQYLLELGVLKEGPPGLPDFLGHHDPEAPIEEPTEESESPNDCVFSVNPFCGSRVRQSGTMANDLYVKNRWFFGGLFGGFSTKPNKKRRIGGSGNTKKNNPALV